MAAAVQDTQSLQLRILHEQHAERVREREFQAEQARLDRESRDKQNDQNRAWVERNVGGCTHQ